MCLTVRTISSTSFVARHTGKASTPARLLEEQGLPLHHRQRRLGADVAEAEDGRPVGHDGHGVLLDRQGEGALRIFPDGEADAGDTRRVGHGQVVTRLQGHLVADLDLSAEMHEEGPVRDAHDPDAVDAAAGGDDGLAVQLVARVDGEVADDDVLDQLDEIDGPDVAAGLADGRREAAEHARPVLDRCPDGEAVRGAGSEGHGTPRPAALCPARSPAAARGTAPGSPGRCARTRPWTATPQLAGEDDALEVSSVPT